MAGSRNSLAILRQAARALARVGAGKRLPSRKALALHDRNLSRWLDEWWPPPRPRGLQDPLAYLDLVRRYYGWRVYRNLKDALVGHEAPTREVFQFYFGRSLNLKNVRDRHSRGGSAPRAQIIKRREREQQMFDELRARYYPDDPDEVLYRVIAGAFRLTTRQVRNDLSLRDRW